MDTDGEYIGRANEKRRPRQESFLQRQIREELEEEARRECGTEEGGPEGRGFNGKDREGRAVMETAISFKQYGLLGTHAKGSQTATLDWFRSTRPATPGKGMRGVAHSLSYRLACVLRAQSLDSLGFSTSATLRTKR